MLLPSTCSLGSDPCPCPVYTLCTQTCAPPYLWSSMAPPPPLLSSSLSCDPPPCLSCSEDQPDSTLPADKSLVTSYINRSIHRCALERCLLSWVFSISAGKMPSTQAMYFSTIHTLVAPRETRVGHPHHLWQREWITVTHQDLFDYKSSTYQSGGTVCLKGPGPCLLQLV